MSWNRLLGCLVLVLLATGCSGGGGRGKVAGKVSVNDQAVTGGEIKFHGPNNALMSTQIRGDGVYEIPDVPAGDWKVTVHRPTGLMAGGGAPPKGVTAPEAPASTGAGKGPPIPNKYQSPDSTDLKVSVKSGDNVFDAKLTR